MRPVRLTLSSVTTSAPIPVDWRLRPTDITLQVIVANSNTSSVQYTTDDLSGAITNWFDVSGMAALTASTKGSITTPVTAVRLNMTVWASGSARLDVISNGP